MVRWGAETKCYKPCLDIAMNQNQLQLQDLYNFDEGPERNTA